MYSKYTLHQFCACKFNMIFSQKYPFWCWGVQKEERSHRNSQFPLWQSSMTLLPLASPCICQGSVFFPMWVLIIGACEQIGMRLVLWKAVVLSQQCHPNGASFLSSIVGARHSAQARRDFRLYFIANRTNTLSHTANKAIFRIISRARAEPEQAAAIFFANFDFSPIG